MKIFKNITKREKILLIILSVVVLCFIVTSLVANNKNNSLKIANNNIIALQDTIATCKLKNGELLHKTQSLVIEKEELENYLSLSKEEIKNLEKELDAKLLYISKIEGKVDIDTIYINTTTTQIDSITYRYNFKDSNEYYTINGYTDVMNNKVATTMITENSMDLKLKVGLDNNWKIFVTTDNPYVSLSTIEGALVDKNVFLKEQKKPRFSIGIQGGFGVQYGLMRKQFDYGPYIGFGFEYNFISW